jgi:predicted transcriptional regulator of viral defense system
VKQNVGTCVQVPTFCIIGDMTPQRQRRHGRKRDPGRIALPGLLRARDLGKHGVSRGQLPGMVRRGEVERVGRGLYRLPSAPIHELETVAAVSKQVPGAVICLLTALHIHTLGTQAPRDVWIALDRKARLPSAAGLRVRVVRFAPRLLRYSIETRGVLGVRVRITSRARTVVDCFRYRKKIGLDVALEALRDAVGSHRVNLDEIVRIAKACRIHSVMRPYLEAMAT